MNPSAALARRTGGGLLLILLFASADLAALVGAFLVAFYLRLEVLPELFSALGRPLQPFIWTPADYLRFWPGLALWTAAFASERLYRARRVFWEEARHLLRATTLAFVAILVTAFAFRVRDELSRPLLVATFLLAPLFALALRRLLRRLLRDSALYSRPLLLVAAPEIARRVIRLLERERALGYRIAAVMPPLEGAGIPPGLPLSTPGAQALEQSGACDLIVAVADLPPARVAELLEETAGRAEQVRLVPDLAGLPITGLEAEPLGEIPVLNVPQNLIDPWSLILKRILDLMICLLALPFAGPLLAALWWWVKLDSPGAPMLHQPRLARGGGTFDCLKFRSMHLDADARLDQYFKEHPEARAEWDTYQKIKGADPRVTRAGRWLRKLSLDELPQLFNIFRGEMSLIGPRPYLPRELETMGRHAPVIVRARPGITGLWQVSGRNELTFAQRLQLDEWYVRNWSLWLDLTLLLRTPGALLRRGAY